MQQQQQKEREVLYSRKWVLTSLVQLKRRKKFMAVITLRGLILELLSPP